MGRKSQQRTVVMVAAGVVAALVLTTVVIAGIAALTYVTRPAANKVYERAELRTAVTGKTQDEVIGLLGRPNRTSGDGTEWAYYDRSYDKVSGQTDGVIYVIFRDGRVSEIRF